MTEHVQTTDRPVDLASVRRAAAIVHVGEPAVWKAIRRHEVTGYRDGNATRVSVAELRAWRDPVPPISADSRARIVELFVSAIRRQARARAR